MSASRNTIPRVVQAIAAATIMLLPILGCATAKRLNELSVGMSKSQVIRVLGKPNSTSAAESTEILRYQLWTREQPKWPWAGASEEYLVKVVNGRVVSFGRMGDIDVQSTIQR